MRWSISKTASVPLALGTLGETRAHLHILRAHRIDGSISPFGMLSVTHVILPCDSCDNDKVLKRPQYNLQQLSRWDAATKRNRTLVHSLLRCLADCLAMWPTYGKWYFAYYCEAAGWSDIERGK